MLDFLLVEHDGNVVVLPLTPKAKGFFRECGVICNPRRGITVPPRAIEALIADIVQNGCTYRISTHTLHTIH
jgi:hypothetical protein